MPCLAAAGPSRAEVPITALESTPAASLVPLLGSSLIGSLPSARVVFQSDRGFPWGEWAGKRKRKKINYSLSESLTVILCIII